MANRVLWLIVVVLSIWQSNVHAALMVAPGGGRGNEIASLLFAAVAGVHIHLLTRYPARRRCVDCEARPQETA